MEIMKSRPANFLLLLACGSSSTFFVGIGDRDSTQTYFKKKELNFEGSTTCTGSGADSLVVVWECNAVNAYNQQPAQMIPKDVYSLKLSRISSFFYYN